MVVDFKTLKFQYRSRYKFQKSLHGNMRGFLLDPDIRQDNNILNLCALCMLCGLKIKDLLKLNSA